LQTHIWGHNVGWQSKQCTCAIHSAAKYNVQLFYNYFDECSIFVPENDNRFPDEFILWLKKRLCEKKKTHICQLDDPDWWCFPRPKNSVFYKTLVYSKNEIIILDCELSSKHLLNTSNIESIVLEVWGIKWIR
jgi:hypothetical protein